jgi:hypothetical protein
MGVNDAGTERYDSMSTADYAHIVAERTVGDQGGVGHANQVNQEGPPALTPRNGAL